MCQVDEERAQSLPIGPVIVDGLAFISPILTEALAYWRTIKGDAKFPRRADMDPEQVVSLWPHILMVDILEDGDYFVRLFGQNLVNAYGEQTGRKVSESTAPDRVRKRSIQLFDFCVSQALPCYAYWPEAKSGMRTLFDVEALCLPLSSDGVVLDRLMSLNVNSRRDR